MIHPIALWRMAKHWAVPAALLLAIALVGAWIWSLNAERTRLIAWGERTCLAAGALFEEPGAPRGRACGERVRQLARDEAHVRIESARLSAEALALDRRLTAADARQFAADRAQAASAAQQMEDQDATIGEDGRVGLTGGTALDRAGGLRPAR